MKMYVTYPKDRPDSTIHWESGVRRTPNAAIDVVSTLALHYSVITSDTKRIAPPPPFPLRLSCRVLRFAAPRGASSNTFNNSKTDELQFNAMGKVRFGAA
ncbi:hypothetical protein J6590_071586 [Homalodisca vitripennis]|nr:hypothetical protein J6590_071586 [Homalodisca vitripennis]